MKKIYISVMASLLLFPSCSDYLDVNSPSTFDKEYVFGSESEILLLSMACMCLWSAVRVG